MNEVESPLNVWNEHPPFPIKNAPVFVWPPRPVAALKYLLGEERVGHGLLGRDVWLVSRRHPRSDGADPPASGQPA